MEPARAISRRKREQLLCMEMPRAAATECASSNGMRRILYIGWKATCEGERIRPDGETRSRSGRVRCIAALRSGYAGDKETEEGVGIGVEANLRVGRAGGAGRAGVVSRKALFVDADVHGLGGAKCRIDEEGDGHGIKERGRFLAPLVIENGKSVGDGRALTEEVSAFDLVKLELGGVEGHDEERHARSEELLSRGDVVEDVPFGLWGRGLAETDIAVTALDGAAHQDDALELAEAGGVFINGGADIHERSDSDQSDLAGVVANLIEEEGDSAGVGGFGEMAGFGVATLGKVGFGRHRRASSHRNVRAA